MLTPDSPPLQTIFSVAAGSIVGRRHAGSGNLLAGRNNQDSYVCTSLGDCILLSVQDGCGSAPYSEFGARLASILIPQAVSRALRSTGLECIDHPEFLQLVFREFQKRLWNVVEVCSTIHSADEPEREDGHEEQPADRYDDFIHSNLLFTVLGALLTPKTTVIFGMGDGVFVINQQVQVLGPFPDNAPDYPGKLLSSFGRTETPLQIPQQTRIGKTSTGDQLPAPAPDTFRQHACLDTGDLETLLIGTDGALDLLNNAETFIPGKNKRVGSSKELFEAKHFFAPVGTGSAKTNCPSDSLTCWLRLINSEVARLEQDGFGPAVLRRHCGLLPDDTTLVAVRRTFLPESKL